MLSRSPTQDQDWQVVGTPEVLPSPLSWVLSDQADIQPEAVYFFSSSHPWCTISAMPDPVIDHVLNDLALLLAQLQLVNEQLNAGYNKFLPDGNLDRKSEAAWYELYCQSVVLDQKIQSDRNTYDYFRSLSYRMRGTDPNVEFLIAFAHKLGELTGSSLDDIMKLSLRSAWTTWNAIHPFGTEEAEF